MGVPEMTVVNVGLTAVFAGGVMLLMVAAWWSWAGDGIAVPRDRWPAAARATAALGWALFIGGILAQVVSYFARVGVARW